MAPQRPKPNPAEYTGLAQELRATIWYGSEHLERYRDEWPRLWELLDRLVKKVDRDFPSPMTTRANQLF